jgi:hypothetical protein
LVEYDLKHSVDCIPDSPTRTISFVSPFPLPVLFLLRMVLVFGSGEFHGSESSKNGGGIREWRSVFA